MAEVNCTDHLVRSEKDTLANGYDNDGYHPHKEEGEEEPSNDDDHLRGGAPGPVPNGHAHEETNGHVNGTAVIVLQEEDEEEDAMDDHTSQQKPLDTRLHHYIPVEDIDRKILNGSEVSIPEDAVISFSTGRVKCKKGGSSSPQSPRGDIPLETLPPSYGDQDETRSEKAGLEAELNKNGVWSSAEGYTYGNAESQFVVNEKLNGTNKSSNDEVSLPVSNHRKCLSREESDSSSEHKPTGEKLYFTSEDSRKSCPNWKKLLICGAATVVISVIILLCVFAATGIIYSKNTRYESGHSLPSVDTIAHAGASWPRTSSSSKVPHKSSQDSLPNTTSKTELDTVTRAPSTVSLKVPLMNDSSHSQTIVPNALVGEFTIIDENFTYDLNDNTSRGYMVLANNLETELRRIFREKGARFDTIKILNFRPGSIKVKFLVLWNSDQGIIRSDRATEILTADLRQKNNSFYNFFSVDINSIHFTDAFDECRIQKGGCTFDCSWDYDTLIKTCTCSQNMYLLPDGRSCAPISETSSISSSTPAAVTLQEEFFSTVKPTESPMVVTTQPSRPFWHPVQEITTTRKPTTTSANPEEENSETTEISYTENIDLQDITTTNSPLTTSSQITDDMVSTEKKTESNFDVSAIDETTTTNFSEDVESAEITESSTETTTTSYTKYEEFTTTIKPFIREKVTEESIFPTEPSIATTTVRARSLEEDITEFPFERAQNETTLKFHIEEPTTEVYTFDSKIDYPTDYHEPVITTTQSVPNSQENAQSTTMMQETTYPSTYNPKTYGSSSYSPTTYNPGTYNPTAYNPTNYNPTTYNPTTYNPATYNPTTYNPTVYNPTTYNPTVNNPTTYNPTVNNPTTYNPTIYNPTTYNPSTYNPTTNNPSAYNPTAYNPAAYTPSTYNPTTFGTSTYNPTTYNPSTNSEITNPITHNEEIPIESEADTTTTDLFNMEPNTTVTTASPNLDIKKEGTDQTYFTTLSDDSLKSKTESTTLKEAVDYETAPFTEENSETQTTVFPFSVSNKTNDTIKNVNVESTTLVFTPFFNRTPGVRSYDNFTDFYDTTSHFEDRDYFKTDAIESETETNPYMDNYQPTLNLSSEFNTSTSPAETQTVPTVSKFIDEVTNPNLGMINISEEFTTLAEHFSNLSGYWNMTETVPVNAEVTNITEKFTSVESMEKITTSVTPIVSMSNFSESVTEVNVFDKDLTTAYDIGTTIEKSTETISEIMDAETSTSFKTEFPSTKSTVTIPEDIADETTLPYTTDMFTTKTDTTATEPSSMHAIGKSDKPTLITNLENETTTQSYFPGIITTISPLESKPETSTTNSEYETENPFTITRKFSDVTSELMDKDSTTVNTKISNISMYPENFTETTMIPNISKSEGTTRIFNEEFVSTYLDSEIDTTIPTESPFSITTRYAASPEIIPTAISVSDVTTTARTSSFSDEKSATTTKNFDTEIALTTPYSTDLDTETEIEKAAETTVTEYNLETTATTFSELNKSSVTYTTQNPFTESNKDSIGEISTTEKDFTTETHHTIFYTESPLHESSSENSSNIETVNTTSESTESPLITGINFSNETADLTKDTNMTLVGEGTTPIFGITSGTEFLHEAEEGTTIAPYVNENFTSSISESDNLEFNSTNSMNKLENITGEFGVYTPEIFNSTDHNYTFDDGNYTTTGFEGLINETTTNASVGIVCREDQFICEPLNICLNNTFMCDGIQDCPDGIDEFECQESCHLNFRCSNTSSMCIMAEAHCDGIWDCENGTDEENCAPTECAKHEVMCLDHSKCIRPSDICDLKYDCKDRSDEVGCVERTTCESGGRFFCNDGLCIPWSLKCDGEFDCKDKEDEGNCTCLSDEFQCNDGKCLKSSSRCDGHQDCHDADDEMGCVNVDSQHIVTTYEPYSGTWALLCAEDFNLDDGHYLCQELGFGHALKTEKVHVSFNGTWMAMRRDNLTDSSLWTERVAFVESCTSSLAAAVECQKFACGEYSGLLHRRRKRDIHGGSSSATQWPFIGYTSTFQSNKGCLSEILTPIWLITSADCLLSISREPFNGSDWYVRTNIGRDVEAGMAQNHEVLRIINHPHSSKFRSLILRDYDVALIRLKHALVFVSDKIGAICPPEEQVPPGITCFSGVLGTQKPRAPPPTTLTINSLALQILDRKNCNSVEHYNNQINQRMLCTQSSEGHTICDNDESTPLMCLTGINKWFLAGMLTYQRFCEVYSKHPAVFSNLYAMRKFIDQVTGQKQYEISYNSNVYVIIPPTTPSPTVPETTTLYTTTEITTELAFSGTATGYDTTEYTTPVTYITEGTTEIGTLETESLEEGLTETTVAEIATEEMRGEENGTTVSSMTFTGERNDSGITMGRTEIMGEVKEALTTVGLESSPTTLSPFAFKVYQDGTATPTSVKEEMVTIKDQVEFSNSNASDFEPHEFGNIFNVSDMANKTHDSMIIDQPNGTFSYDDINTTEISLVTEMGINQNITTITEEMMGLTETTPADVAKTTLSTESNSTRSDVVDTTELSMNRMPVMSVINETAFIAPERLTFTTLPPELEGEPLTTIPETTESKSQTEILSSTDSAMKSARLESEPMAYTENPLFRNTTEVTVPGSISEKSVTEHYSETEAHTENPFMAKDITTTESSLKLKELEGFTEKPHLTTTESSVKLKELEGVTENPLLTTTESSVKIKELEGVTENPLLTTTESSLKIKELEGVTENSHFTTTESSLKIKEQEDFTENPHLTEETLTPAIETTQSAFETTFVTEKPSTVVKETTPSDLRETTPATETGTLIIETEVDTDGDLAIIAFNDSDGIIVKPLESVDELGNMENANNTQDYLTRSRMLEEGDGLSGIVYESTPTKDSEVTTDTPASDYTTTQIENVFASLLTSKNISGYVDVSNKTMEDVIIDINTTPSPEAVESDTSPPEEETETENPLNIFDKLMKPFEENNSSIQNDSMMGLHLLTDELIADGRNTTMNIKDTCGMWDHPSNTSSFNETQFYHGWPALGYLQMIAETKMCAASIVSSLYVVTSLNCLSLRDHQLDPNKWAFVGGLYDEESQKDGVQNHLVTKIIPFTNTSMSVLFHENNLALVQLKDEIVSGKYSKNVCLPKDVEQPDMECYTTGWSKNASGDDKGKQYFSVPVDIISQDVCNSTTNYNGLLSDSLICAIYRNQSVPTCQMDFGSPLFCLNDDKWELHGLLNFPNPCDMVQPAVYNSVNSIREWIMDTLLDKSS